MPGNLPLGPAQYVAARTPSQTEQVTRKSLESYLPRRGKAVPVRLGSAEEGYQAEWLPPKDREFLADPKTSPEASVLTISADGVTVVGKGKWGMLYGVQTVNQLIRGTETSQGAWKMNVSLPCLTIRDWPDMPWRCLSPQMTWYPGYNRLEGYDNGNWTLDEWKWLVDWSLLHKCNGWALCMYGNWPFTLPGYAETTLDVDMMFEGVYGSQYPSTGAPLHRDYQYLAVEADRAVDLAAKTFQLYTGRAPDLDRPGGSKGDEAGTLSEHRYRLRHPRRLLSARRGLHDRGSGARWGMAHDLPKGCAPASDGLGTLGRSARRRRSGFRSASLNTVSCAGTPFPAVFNDQPAVVSSATAGDCQAGQNRS